MSLRVGFDLDGVIADFRTAFQDAAVGAGVARGSDGTASPTNDPLSSRDIKAIWDHVKRTPNWWTSLEPYEPGQLARLYALARRCKWEVVFMTRRPATDGDPVQFQSQCWLEQHGFLLPAVVTVPGSRGELANALRLDVAIDDQLLNCVDIVGSSTARTLLLLRNARDPSAQETAMSRGIGVVATVKEAIDVVVQLHESMGERRGRLQRLSEWFGAAPTPPAPTPTSSKRERTTPRNA